MVLNRQLVGAAVAALLVVGGLIAASLLLQRDDEAAAPTTAEAPPALFDGIPQERAVLGSPTATVTLSVFEDLQCPVCRRFVAEGLPGIVDEYVRPGKVKLRLVGLAFIGPDSEKALLHALAAGAQGKLWEFADLLYANQGGENKGWVTDELLERISGDLGLDHTKLAADADAPAVLRQANAMATEAERREVPGTPWFYVQVGDAEPYEVRPGSFEIEEFRTILDDALDG